MKQKRKKIPYGSKLPVYFSDGELRLVREHTFVNLELGRLAVRERGKLKVELSLDDIEEVLGYIAAEADHMKNMKIQRDLDRIFDKLQRFIDAYDDQGE